MKVNLAFVQIGNSIADMKGALHVVGNDDAGHAVTFLQTAN